MRSTTRHIAFALMSCVCMAVAGWAKTLSVPNASFDPLIDASGAAPFTTIGDAFVASPLGVEYWIVQRDRRMTPEWRALVAANSAKILAVLPEDALLVSVAERPGGGGGGIADLDTVRWAGRYRPSYKVSAAFAPVFGGGDIASLLDSDGRLRLLTVLHRGEDLRILDEALRAALPQVEIVGSGIPLQEDFDGSFPRLALRAESAGAADVISVLARFDAVFYIEPWGDPAPALDDSVWFTQTLVPPALAPPDGTAFRYDWTAKLFARGLTGRGQVYATLDSGVENDDCHFRYGPNISDTTQFVPASIQPPNTVPLGDPSHRPANKVIAYYLVDRGTSGACAAVPYDETGHGTSTTGCAVGDDFFVPAARAGESLDDPGDDEEASLASQLFAINIDHHQHADGMAPGAQVVLQDVNLSSSGCPGIPVANVLRQAYETWPGARVHNNSWGTLLGSAQNDYGTTESDIDLESWRRRDMLVVFAAGNEGPMGTTLRTQVDFKNGLTVGSTERGNAGPGGGPTTDVAFLSSHGPGWPDRIKPELAVPGEQIEMPRAFSNTPETGVGDGNNGCNEFVTSGGTSFAAPTLSGLALDVRQYFVDGYYPGGAAGSSTGFVPTNSLLKAILVNSTRNLGGLNTADSGTGQAPRPTMGQGWGNPVLDDTLFFAGDPTQPFEGERSFLLVLNDVPNGVTGAVNDARPDLLDSFQPALQELEVHSFTICVEAALDLHATLAWSDTPGTPAAGPGVHPLRNDLDLEMIDPLGRVWRPDPRTAVWSNGASVLAPAGQDTTGNGPDRLNANWDPPLDSSVIDEDFQDADRSNPIENVFISRFNTDFRSGIWKLNVIGFSVDGNGHTSDQAWPNFVDTDGDLQSDTISDLRQGYSLVVSGMVSTPRGIVHFDQATYTCGQFATVLLTDCDGDLTSPLEVTVTTSLGDCDRLVIGGSPPFQNSTSFVVTDSEAGTLPGTCDVVSDGFVVVGDDGMLRATYLDTSPAEHAATAAARMTCRDVRFVSVAVADACDPTTANGLLNRNEPATLLVTLENTRAVAIGSLWGRLFPDDEDVLVPDGGVVIGGIQAGPGAQVIVPIPIFVEPDQPCPSTLRFRLELFGTRGFRDRVYFDLPLAACALGTGPGLRPGEVPAVDVPGVRQALRVAKAGPAQAHLSLTWDRAADAERYDIWRGLINALVSSGYTHSIPLGDWDLCNILELDGGDDPAILNQQVLLQEALDVDPDPPQKANFYYLVTAKATCDSDLVSLVGPVGFANRDRDFVPDPDERRPAGLLLDPGCTP